MLVGPKKIMKYYANITRLKEKRALRVSLIAHTVHARLTPEKLDWPSHMLPWTEEEERILRENYPVMRTRITELLPHRSKAACTLRASQKKISSRNKSKKGYSGEDE